MQIEQRELTTLKGQVSKLENQAQSVTIESQEDYANAVDLVSKLKETGSQIKIKKESITKPLNEALRSARDLFSPIEEQFASAEAIVKLKLLAYKKRVDEEARAKEIAIAAKVEAGKMKLPTAEKKMEAIERVETTTRGKTGEVQVRKIKKVRIIDEAALPRKYMVPNYVMLRQDALKGIIIPGAEVYEEETIAAGTF